jgi:hypothetical protein
MTKSYKYLLIGLVISLVVSLSLFILYQTGKIEYATFRASFAGIIIALVNYLIGFYLLKIGLNKPDKLFLTIVMGGMVIRLFLVLISIIISIKLLKISQDSFIFAIFTFYIFFLTLEIINLSNRDVKVITK